VWLLYARSLCMHISASIPPRPYCLRPPACAGTSVGLTPAPLIHHPQQLADAHGVSGWPHLKFLPLSVVDAGQSPQEPSTLARFVPTQL
jgi:hypothetical protein